ncbi:MAG: peptidoglycan editing factor PgeF [Hyphomicrobiales bacterium]|nr:peptidoglycan editing factor PgeF [Hyphomicrobiales bacterium]
MLTADNLINSGIIRHGFFTRQGGVSRGIYESLNCGVGSRDNLASVLQNRDIAMQMLGLSEARLATPYQVHGKTVVVVDAPWEAGQGPRADGVVTNTPGIAVGIGTADCSPILFSDPDAHVVGAAHAGWRGALAGIAEATIEAMVGIGARRERIHAAIGPMISAANYEVGPELIEAFVADDGNNRHFFGQATRPGHAMFDLPGYLVDRLQKTGIASVENLRRCTYAEDSLFFSYRRATHRNEDDYGRLLSAIAIVE